MCSLTDDICKQTAYRGLAYDSAPLPHGWAGTENSLTMDGMPDSADYRARQLLPDSGDELREQRYIRLAVRRESAHDDLNAMHGVYFAALSNEAGRIIKDQGEDLDVVTGMLDRTANV